MEVSDGDEKAVCYVAHEVVLQKGALPWPPHPLTPVRDALQDPAQLLGRGGRAVCQFLQIVSQPVNLC